MAKTFGIISLKGGVGKTSVVASLGEAIAGLGKKVLLVDGNFSAPNLGLHLDILRPEKTIHDVLENKIHIKDAIIELENFDFVPASLSGKSQLNFLKLKDKIKDIRRLYDIIILDSSPALNEETLAVMLASDYILVVTTPDFPTLSATLKAVKLANQRGTSIAGLILNRVYNKNFEISLDDIERAVEVPVMAVIPHDISALKAVSEAVPYTAYKPGARGSKEYRRLAETLVGERKEPIKLRKFFTWISPKKQEVNRQLFYDRVFR